MIDHVSLPVGDMERARAFYDRVLATLGSRRLMDIDDQPGFVASGYGSTHPAFWIGASRTPARSSPEGQHVAFAAPSRSTVDAFHRAALEAGGQDNGAPGLRPHYHPDYYAAFAIDPDGHHIEAVCHAPPA